MKGWLVVNEFVHTEKFNELFAMLLEAAKREKVELVKCLGATAWVELEKNDYKRLPGVDFILFWDKDVKLARALEKTGVRVFNSSEAIANCDDKAKTYIELKTHSDIPMPKTLIAPKKFHADGELSETFLNAVREELGFPCIVKECMGSFGQQVYMANDAVSFAKILREIGSRDCLVQEYVKTSYGRDIRVQVVGERVVATMYRYNDNDFRANVSNGGSMKNYEPNEAQKEIAVNACKYLGLDFGGVDILFGKDDAPIVCEVNSNAHFKNLYDCTGINVADEIIRHIKSNI